MKASSVWRSVCRSALAGALVVCVVTTGRAQERRGDDPAARALGAQKSALAESVLAAKEDALGEPFDAALRASLKTRMESLSVEQLAALADAGEFADIPHTLGDLAADLVYTPVAPCRVFDTRPGQGGPGPIAANSQINVEIAGTTGFPAQGGTSGGCGIPVGATAVIINFAVVSPAGAGNLRAWAVANPQPAAPLAAVMNYGVVAGLAALANGVAVPICDPAATSCTLGDMRLQSDVSATNVVGDVVGYFKAPTGIPGTLADTAFAIGAGSDPGPTRTFLVTPAQSPVAAGQRVHVVSHKALGAGASAAGDLDLYICYRSTAPGALLIPYGTGLLDLAAAANTRQDYGLSSVVIGLAAGTYQFGLCGSTSSPNWTNNDWSYTSLLLINQP